MGFLGSLRVWVWVLALLLLAGRGWAQTVAVPELREGRYVYTIPGGFVPEKMSFRGLEELNRTAARLRYPFYVVFVQDLPTRSGRSTEEDTERAVVALAEGWARNPSFERNRSSIFLVSYGPGDRKYKLMPGPLWRSELGLEYGKLDPYVDIFKQHARRDPQYAIEGVLKAFDRDVYDGFDPARKAELELIAQQRAAMARQVALTTGGILTVVVLLAVAIARSRRFSRDQAAVQARVQEWRGWVSKARERYFEFDQNRDRAPHLRQFGGETHELYGQTVREIDAIIIGVEAVAAHLDAVERKAQGSNFLFRSGLNTAQAELDQPVEFSTGKISEKLFEPTEEVIRVTPRTFLSNLSDRYDAAVGNWHKLNRAVDLSLRLPEELLPHQKLDELMEEADRRQIPFHWLEMHPLIGDAEADRTLYESVDALRGSDPVAYMRRVEELQGRESEVESVVQRLVAAQNRTNAHRVESLPALATVLLTEDDPQVTLESAQRKHRRFGEALAGNTQVEKVEEKAAEIDGLYLQAAAQHAAAEEAIRNAGARIQDLEARIGLTRRTFERADARLVQAAEFHANLTDVRELRTTAQSYLDEVVRGVARAKELRAESRHLEASRVAERAAGRLAEADARLTEVFETCDEMDAKRAQFEHRLLEMSARRREFEMQIRRYRGMQQLPDFVNPYSRSGPVDYGILLGVLYAQEQEWNRIARRAEMDFLAAEQARREAEQARAAAWSSSSSSSSDSSGSSGGSWSGGDSGSSGGSW